MFRVHFFLVCIVCVWHELDQKQVISRVVFVIIFIFFFLIVDEPDDTHEYSN